MEQNSPPSFEPLERRTFLSGTPVAEGHPRRIVIDDDVFFVSFNANRGGVLHHRPADDGVFSGPRERLAERVIHVSRHRGGLVVVTGGADPALYRFDPRGGGLRYVRSLGVNLGDLDGHAPIVRRAGNHLYFAVSDLAGDSLWRVHLSGRRAPTLVRNLGAERIVDARVVANRLVFFTQQRGFEDRVWVVRGTTAAPLGDIRGDDGGGGFPFFGRTPIRGDVGVAFAEDERDH